MDTYYNPEDLAQFSNMGEDAPELWDKFMVYYGQVFTDGALSSREKCLICFCSGTCGTMPLLYRFLCPIMSPARIQPRADD